MRNWAGNITFGARQVHRPSTVESLRELVAGADRVRALGTGHSFNRIADSPGVLVSTADLPASVSIDAAGSSVTVSAGLRYAQVAEHLHGAGYALANLGSLPHISVGGATQTGTHGSGDRNGNLATAVSAVELVTADGGAVTVRRGDDDFPGIVVGLGSVGILTALTLDIEPTYDIGQHVYLDLPRLELDRHFDEVFSAGYSVSAFTDWRGPRVNQVWVKRRSPAAASDPPSGASRWLGAAPAERPSHPIAGMPADNCTEQLGVPGPWHTRLPHFRPEHTPSSGDELQAEYFVPREHAVAALAALDEVSHRIAPVLQICEIRTIAADDLWLSPCHGRDSVAIHFTWLQNVGAVTPVLAAIEERLAPFQARPHWGKLFLEAASYPRLPDFRALLRRYDPGGKFRNEFVDHCLDGR